MDPHEWRTLAGYFDVAKKSLLDGQVECLHVSGPLQLRSQEVRVRPETTRDL
jgi:hypothetical protein